MDCQDYTNYTNSVLISYLLTYKIMFAMIAFSSQISVAERPSKGHDSIRGSGPLTADRPWEAVVNRGRGW